MKSLAESRQTALILVDLQNDFVEGGALAVPGGKDVIPIANRLIPLFDLVVATQDWHPADHLSFASQHPGLEPGQVFQLNQQPQVAWPDHCVQNTFGAEFEESLNIGGIHRVVQKGTDRSVDSYSGFFDNDHRTSTGLAELLRQSHITRVVVMGLATDYCVRFTVLDAVKQGFSAQLIQDGCRGVNLHPQDVDAAIREMATAGVELLQSADIVG